MLTYTRPKILKSTKYLCHLLKIIIT
uniref:Uncharacterized protein n=1 Tax=Triticum urartu TaxID=4572 RepID=A0A8R7UBH2_TRIUA